MSLAGVPEPPAQLRAIQNYMRVAADIEKHDSIVAYWARLHATDVALGIDRDSAEAKKFLNDIIIWLEQFKKQNASNEAVTNQTVGQAHVENFIIALFNKADTLDRDGKADKSTVRMFFMAAILFETMATFGPITDEINKRLKYAKFKAAYITKCLNSGQTPKPGPIEGSDLETPTDGTSEQKPSVPANPEPQNNSQKSTSDVSSQDSFIMVPRGEPPKSETRPTMPSNPPRIPETQPSLVPTQPSRVPPAQPCAPSSISATRFHATNGAPLKPEDILQTQKYCKFANSALQYDDIPTAVANLEKALTLLKTGQNSG